MKQPTVCALQYHQKLKVSCHKVVAKISISVLFVPSVDKTQWTI
jgi:hypothetical protein